MKLLVVSQYFWPETFRINDICAGLKERGWDIDVLTSLPNVPEGKFYEGYGWFKRGEKQHDGINIERVGVIQRGRNNPIRWMFNCASFAVNSLFHIPKLAKNEYDAVFVFNNSPITKLLPAKVMAKKKNIPNIVFVLDIWPDSMFFLLGLKDKEKEGFFRRAARSFCRWLYKSADLILISSEGMSGKLRGMGLSCPIEYFPNYAEPFSTDCAKRTREELGISGSKDVKVIGFAGNIGSAQGLDKLVEAAELSAVRNNSVGTIPQMDSRENNGKITKAVSTSILPLKNDNLVYLIVGDGPELPAIKSAVNAAKLNDRFVFTGWVDGKDVPGYLDICDALLVSLKDSGVLNEVVPAKLQTYMNAGKPVIAFMNGAGADIVNAARCGFTAPADDSAALAKVLDSVSSVSDDELKDLGNNAKKYCRANFDREKILGDLERYIKTAVSEYGRH